MVEPREQDPPSNAERDRLPPGPRGREILRFLGIGNSSGVLTFFEEMARRYGPVSGFRAFGQTIVLLDDADLIEEVLQQQQHRFVRDTTAALLRDVVGDGVLTLEDPAHLTRRRLLQPAFHRALSDVDLRNELITFVLAGHETTANALTWAWYLLSLHPAVEAKLHAELDAVLPDRAPTIDDLPRLRYTANVFAETLRLYPPAGSFGRRRSSRVRPRSCAPHGASSRTSSHGTRAAPRRKHESRR